MKNVDRGSSKYPDKRSVIAEIWRRYENGLPMNYSAIHNEDDALRRRCTTLFGGYKYAVEAAGFTYDAVRVDTDTASYCGNLFESLLSELLTDLSVEFEQYSHSKYRPDFVLSNNRWIDAKLSEWTVYNSDCDTVKKYEPFCRSLTIVYMRGKVIDKMITNKTRIVHVNLLIKQLPKHKQTYYKRKIDAILTKLDSNDVNIA